MIQDRTPVEPDAKKEKKSRDRKDFSKFYSSVIRESPSLPIDTSPVEMTCFLSSQEEKNINMLNFEENTNIQP